jgi:catechol 2,3-dioxygenase-like lactoylglutathione lyase family enzyme
MNHTEDEQFPWQGAQHLSLVTRDLDATVRFYHGLLGMPLCGAMGPMQNHGCHYLFRAGQFIMHFFEQPDAEIPTPPVGWEKHGVAFLPGAYQHVAFELAGETALLDLHTRLSTAGVTVTDVSSEGPIQLFHFTDNNGILIELNWTPFDTFAMPIDYGYPALFSDPDPVPAVQELIRSGRLTS